MNNANIQLFDALGRRLNANIAGYAGNYEIQLPLGLPKGNYWLKVERAIKDSNTDIDELKRHKSKCFSSFSYTDIIPSYTSK